MSELIAHIKAENAKTAAWVAEDPDRRFAGMMTEDPDHWAEYGIYTVAQYEHYMLSQSYIELYKSIHGVKPRWMNFDGMSMAELEKAMERLSAENDEFMAREAAREERAIAKFNAVLDASVAAGAPDRATAFRWMKDAFGDDAAWYGDEVIEHHYGLPYGYIKENI